MMDFHQVHPPALQRKPLSSALQSSAMERTAGRSPNSAARRKAWKQLSAETQGGGSLIDDLQ